MADTEITCALANCIPPDVLCLLEDCCGEGTTQNLFETVAVSGQSDVVADSPTDTLTLVAGANVVITTDAGTDSITISASGSGLSVDNYDEVADFASAPAAGFNVAAEAVRDGYIFKALDTNNLWILSDNETVYKLVSQYTQKDTLANFLANIAAVISGTRVGAYEENQYVHIPDEDEWYKVEWVNVAGVEYNVPILQEWPDTTVAVQDEGVEVVSIATVLNFVGAGVTASDAGGGVADIVITGGAGSDTHVANANLLADATYTHDFAGFNQVWTNLGSYSLFADTLAKLESENVGGDLSLVKVTPTTADLSVNLGAGDLAMLQLTGGTFNLEVEDSAANNAKVYTLDATAGASTGEPTLAFWTAAIDDGTATNGQIPVLGDSATGEWEWGDGALALTIEDEGIPIETNTAVMDFVGGGVTVTSTASGEVEVNIPASGCATTNLTTAAFNALRSGAGLNEGCIYEINDHSQGYLTGVLVRLRAVGPSMAAMQCDVIPDASWDSVNAWSGLYDASINKVVMLTDNKGNTAQDWDGTIVGQFPWGAADWNGNRFRNASLAVEAAPTSTLWRNSFENTNTINFTSSTGHMNRNIVGPSTTMTCNSTELDIDANVLGAVAIASNSTAVTELTSNIMGGTSTISFNGSKDTNIRYSVITGQSVLTCGEGNFEHDILHKAIITAGGTLPFFGVSSSFVFDSSIIQSSPIGPAAADPSAGFAGSQLFMSGGASITNNHLDVVQCFNNTLINTGSIEFRNSGSGDGDTENIGPTSMFNSYVEGISLVEVQGGSVLRHAHVFRDGLGIQNVTVDDIQVSLNSDLFFNNDQEGLDIVGPGGDTGPSPRSIANAHTYITENEHHQLQMS